MNRRRDLLLGCLGAALMLVGDLCLSLIPAPSTDSGLFVREAYLNGSYQTWRLPLLLGAGLPGMALIAFGVRGLCSQVRPECGKTRRVMELSGLMYIVSAGALHYLIGSMADWTSVLAPLLGREETAALIAGQYARLTLPSALPTAGMVLFLVSRAWAVAAGKTRLPRGGVAGGVCPDPRYPAAAGGAGADHRFCTEPVLRQRRCDAVDAGGLSLGKEA